MKWSSWNLNRFFLKSILKVFHDSKYSINNNKKDKGVKYGKKSKSIQHIEKAPKTNPIFVNQYEKLKLKKICSFNILLLLGLNLDTIFWGLLIIKLRAIEFAKISDKPAKNRL